MANFEEAEKITGRNEGGYANNPADRGGETFAGIARNFWPNWNGWIWIDKFKVDFGLAKGKTKLNLAQWVNHSARVQPEVGQSISKFYKMNFWDQLGLDKIRDQQLANSIYDFGVNSGVARAAKFAQDIAGVTQDGIIGIQSLKALNAMSPSEAVTAYNSKREVFYRSIAKGDQTQFLKSWLSRLKPYN